MTVIRRKAKKKNYSIIDNAGICDRSLSWKATGLWTWLMSKPEDWEVSLENLCNSKTDGKDSVLSALSELEESGYLLYQRWRNCEGRFESAYTVFESPEQLDEWKETAPSAELGSIAKVSKNRRKQPTVEKPLRKNHSGETTAEKPQWITRSGLPTVGNPRQLNIDIQRTELLRTELLNSPNPSFQEGLEREKEDVWKEKAKESSPQVNPVVSIAEIEIQEESTVSDEDKSSAGGGIQKLAYHHFGMQDPNDRRSRQQREFNWVPEGPWRVNNQLDAAFVDWMALKWQRDYGKDIHTTRANILRHLKKDAANVAIAWDEYHRETLHRFSNAAVRERAGIEIEPKEQQKLLAHTGAIATLPPEIAPVSSAIPQPVQENSVILTSMPQQALPTMGGGVLEPYKEWKPSEAAAKVSLEEARENIERLKELSRTGFQLKAMPQAEKTPETTIEILQDLLGDPICRKDCSVQAKARAFLESNPESVADYGENGIITAIYEF